MGVEGVAPLLGDLRVIVCPIPPQMNDFCGLHGTPNLVSKIAYVKDQSGIPPHCHSLGLETEVDNVT